MSDKDTEGGPMAVVAVGDEGESEVVAGDLVTSRPLETRQRPVYKDAIGRLERRLVSILEPPPTAPPTPAPPPHLPVIHDGRRLPKRRDHKCNM